VVFPGKGGDGKGIVRNAADSEPEMADVGGVIQGQVCDILRSHGWFSSVYINWLFRNRNRNRNRVFCEASSSGARADFDPDFDFDY
jgi:hypothetical protein